MLAAVHELIGGVVEERRVQRHRRGEAEAAPLLHCLIAPGAHRVVDDDVGVVGAQLVENCGQHDPAERDGLPRQAREAAGRAHHLRPDRIAVGDNLGSRRGDRAGKRVGGEAAHPVAPAHELAYHGQRRVDVPGHGHVDDRNRRAQRGGARRRGSA
jgi:hypothetical protein